MNPSMKRLFFIVICAGACLALLAPALSSLGLGASVESLVQPMALWQSLLWGLCISHVGSVFFNYTDFIRYTWPFCSALALSARYSTKAQEIVDRGRSRAIPYTTLRSSVVAYTVFVGALLAGVLVAEFVGTFSSDQLYGSTSALVFLVGLTIGMLADLLIPQPTLAKLRVKRAQVLPLAELPMRWAAPSSTTFNPDLSYAVIIPCHNYGAFLREAIESVLSQTLPPSEVIVVLDDCTDTSAEIATHFSDSVVRSIVVNCNDPYLARRAGFYATSAPLVCCLDADDHVNPSYFASGTRCFLDPDVGIATGSVQHFGLSEGRWDPLPGDIERLNCVSSAGIFRRAAAIGTRAFERMECAGVFEEDYLFWQSIARAGWRVAAFEGTHYHRRHDQNRSLITPTEALWVRKFREGMKDPRPVVRVGYVASVLPPAGGVETLLNQLQKHAFRIEWVGVAHAPEKAESPLIDGTYMGIPILKSRAFDDAVRELAALSDVLYAWQPNDLARLASLDIDVPIWGCVHGQGPYGARAAAYLETIPGAHLVAVSEAARVVCPSGAEVIYNGADLTTLCQGPSRWQQRDIWEIKEDEFAIGYLGRWSPEKRINLMLSAFPHLPSNIRPVVCVAGELPTAEERRVAEELAGRKIVWTTTSTPGAAYRALDAVVITSDSEGGPLVALEAWACGCPLITTPVGMIPETMLSYGDLAQLLPINPSAQDIALAVVSVLTEKHSTIDRRERAKSTVWSHFTVWRTARAWERGLFKLAERGSMRTAEVEKRIDLL